MICNSEGNITTLEFQILIFLPGAIVYGWGHFTTKRIFMIINSCCNILMTKG
jgi:hypothetical protein